MRRSELPRTKPRDTMAVAGAGSGETEGRPVPAGSGDVASAASAAVPAPISAGFVRGRTDRFQVLAGGRGAALAGGLVQGATALKAEPELPHLDEPQVGFLATPAPTPAAKAAATVADRRSEARMKGYEGESCPECANFTLVRNGTCLKCETCGSTTGCS